jgi:hypothetical protein
VPHNTPDNTLDEFGRFDPKPAGLGGPAGMQHLGVGAAGFRWAAIDHCFRFKFPSLTRCRFAADRVDEPVQFGVDTLVDISGACRELGQHGVGNTGDFGDAVHRWVPLDTQPHCEFGAYSGVIDCGEDR